MFTSVYTALNLFSFIRHHISTGLYLSLSAQRLSDLPLPCVTVCHHSSTGLYSSLSAQRLSESTVYMDINIEFVGVASPVERT